MGLVEGKVIIVTGASSGIGEKTAEVLAAEGAKVVLAARRKEKLEDVANRIIAAGGEAYTVSGDVSVREDCDRIAEETVKKYGRIDVLVNNAGIGDKQMSITRCSDDWWRQIIAVNQDSVFYMSRAALVYMEKKGRRFYRQYFFHRRCICQRRYCLQCSKSSRCGYDKERGYSVCR